MMSFILNLIAFLLIVFGVIFCIACDNSTITNKDKLTKEQIDKVNKIINKIRFYSVCSVVLGVGIIIAKIFA